MKHVEIIVPCYNEEKCIAILCERIEEVFCYIEGWYYSILFVDDGSKDYTLREIKKCLQQYANQKNNIKYITFSRNFGKEAAMYAGLLHAKGDVVVIMDADLQHPPEIIPKMLDVLEDGYDCCGARRISRNGEPIIRSFFSKIFYSAMKRFSGLELVQGGSDFRAMTSRVVEAAVSLEERERFSKGILSWVGFRTKWLEYKNVERVAGTTKWSFFGLFKYAINGIVAFTTTPLRVAVYLGLFIDVVAFIYMFLVLYGTLSGNGERTGYASIICLMLFLGGTVILILGVIGEYLARIYLEIKRRPIYIIRDTNLDGERI